MINLFSQPDQNSDHYEFELKEYNFSGGSFDTCYANLISDVVINTTEQINLDIIVNDLKFKLVQVVANWYKIIMPYAVWSLDINGNRPFITALPKCMLYINWVFVDRIKQFYYSKNPNVRFIKPPVFPEYIVSIPQYKKLSGVYMLTHLDFGYYHHHMSIIISYHGMPIIVLNIGIKMASMIMNDGRTLYKTSSGLNPDRICNYEFNIGGKITDYSRYTAQPNSNHRLIQSSI